MTDVTIALALHVLAVVLWIGGVAMVTTVLLPAARRRRNAEEGMAFFEAVERRFAGQARGATLVAGASGFYMVDRLDLWSDFLSPGFWWLDAMALVWLAFTLMLFVVEPLGLDQRLLLRVSADRRLAVVERFHWVLLIASLITVLGAVAGSHGLTVFG
jgi:hypothetical protein